MKADPAFRENPATSVSGDTRPASPNALRRAALILPTLIGLATLIVYGGLLPAGRWQGDEYLGSWLVATGGRNFLLRDIVASKPLPVSESIRFAYFALSNELNRPLVGPFLGVVWLTSLLGIAVAAWVGRVRRPVGLAIIVFALTLLIAKPGEMFYWPDAAAAYLPCLAGLAAASILLDARNVPQIITLTLALLVVVWTSEIGAATVLVYTILVLVASFGDRTRLRCLILLAAPALGALAVALILLKTRMRLNEVMDAKSGLAGNWPASLGAAVPAFASEVWGISGLPLLAGVTIKALLLVSFSAVNTRKQQDLGITMMWTLALLLGAFASAAAANHQFGTLCCERQTTFRQAMILLALFTVAGQLGGALMPQRSALLAAALLVLLISRAGALHSDWQLRHQVFSARQRTWDSAMGAGDTMTLVLAPTGRIINSDALPIGQYRRTSDVSFEDTPWYAWGIMVRFNKHALTIMDVGG